MCGVWLTCRARRLALGRVWLPSTVHAELKAEADRHRPCETGGVLLGFEDEAGSRDVQVVSAIGPGPGATHLRHRFLPDASWQQERIEEAYRESGQTITYLGDWHSHPTGGTSPSRLDRKTATRISRTPAARAPNPLMLILAGGPPREWTVNAYRYAMRRLHRVGSLIDSAP